MGQYLLRLYITGKSAHSERAIANLRRLCAEELDGRYDIEVIDLLEHPEMSASERILATPTLIKALPLPMRRVIGDLSDTVRVLHGLELAGIEPNGSDTGAAP
ncbi:MAG: circadian clock KaiB family protein [Gammaproteobacteria bacterium]